MSGQQAWKHYEEVACYFLNHFHQKFGLERVDPKQKITGSSTSWEIDAKGVLEGDNSAIMLVECRRYLSKRLNQEDVAGLAYRIRDTGAKGGIIVSPLPLQDGAKKVAKANNIVHVRLEPDSTPEDFVIDFFNKIFVGITNQVAILEHVSGVLTDKDGNKRHC